MIMGYNAKWDIHILDKKKFTLGIESNFGAFHFQFWLMRSHISKWRRILLWIVWELTYCNIFYKKLFHFFFSNININNRMLSGDMTWIVDSPRGATYFCHFVEIQTLYLISIEKLSINKASLMRPTDAVHSPISSCSSSFIWAECSFSAMYWCSVLYCYL